MEEGTIDSSDRIKSKLRNPKEPTVFRRRSDFDTARKCREGGGRGETEIEAMNQYKLIECKLDGSGGTVGRNNLLAFYKANLCKLQ